MEKIEELKEKIKRAYERGEGSFQQLADKYNVKVGTIKSWAKRDKDEGNQWFKIATKTKKTKNHNKKVATKKKEVAEEEKKVAVSEDQSIRETVQKVLENKELNDKQKLFCIYYIKCFNATKAYQKAYGVGYESAVVAGPRLLGNVRVREEIEKLKADKFKGAMLSAQDLLQKYIDIALSDINDFMEYGNKKIPVIDKETGRQRVDDEGNPIFKVISYAYFKDSIEVDGTLISEISQGKDGAKIKVIDKKFALDFLAKYSGLLDIPTQEKLDIERRKMDLLERQADDLDDDIEYVIKDGDQDEEEKED